MKRLVLLASLVLAAPASAATLVELTEFAPSFGPRDPVNKGFSYQQSTAYAGEDALYLHDDGGLTRSVFRSVEGRRFDAVEADIYGYSNAYLTGSGPAPRDWDEQSDWLYDRKPVIDTFGWYGYRDGALVAQVEARIDKDDYSFERFLFGAGFSDLDALEARVLLPDSPAIYFPELDTPDTLWCEYWCAGFQVDSLALRVADTAPSPVPLPPAGALLLGALGAMAFMRRATRVVR